MTTEIHACFDSKDGVMQAVEALLRHGVSEEDITLILPHTEASHTHDGKVSSQVLSEVVVAPKHEGSAVVVAGEEGLGVGLGLGLLTAMCIPGIGMIAGSGNVIASLIAAGTIIGGVAGGIYGYLAQREVPHEVAEAMANHISSGGATLSVMLSDWPSDKAIVGLVEAVGGRIIPDSPV